MVSQIVYRDSVNRVSSIEDEHVVPDEAAGSQQDERELLLVPAESLAHSVRLSAELSDALQALEVATSAKHPSMDVLRDRVAYLEDQVERGRSTREQILAAIPPWADLDQLQVLSALLGAWSQRPNDLLVMVKISEQSTQLVAVIQALQEIRRTVLES